MDYVKELFTENQYTEDTTAEEDIDEVILEDSSLGEVEV